jgi:chromosomal replication initiation ATPase DnaA
MTYKELIIKYAKAEEIAKVQEQYIAQLEELIRERDADNGERLQLKDIMSSVCNYYQVPARDIFGTRRYRHYVRPRQIVCYIAKLHIPDITLKEIGKYLGNRDHSTVIHSVRSVEDEMSYNKRFEKEVNEIKLMLNI